MEIKSKSGKRVILRPPTDTDISLMYEYSREISAEDTYLLVNPREPVTWAEEVEYLRSVLSKIRCGWEIMYLICDGDRMVGSTSITVGGRRKMHQGAFGISLLKPYRHDGIGEQVTKFMLDEARKKLKLSQVCLEVFACNERAIHLYQKIGFIEYGRLPQGLSYRGLYQDAILMYKSLL